jgi:hypothetical protein
MELSPAVENSADRLQDALVTVDHGDGHRATRTCASGSKAFIRSAPACRFAERPGICGQGTPSTAAVSDGLWSGHPSCATVSACLSQNPKLFHSPKATLKFSQPGRPQGALHAPAFTPPGRPPGVAVLLRDHWDAIMAPSFRQVCVSPHTLPTCIGCESVRAVLLPATV